MERLRHGRRGHPFLLFPCISQAESVCHAQNCPTPRCPPLPDHPVVAELVDHHLRKPEGFTQQDWPFSTSCHYV